MSATPRSRTRTPRFVEVRGEVLSDLAESYQPGDRLPSEPDLATAYGVSRPTIREVLRSLEGDGLVRRVHGVGTFVTQVPPTVSSRFDLDLGVTEAVAAAHQQLGVRLLRASLETAPEPIAERLELTRDPAVLWIERVITVNGVAAAHAIDAIPAAVAGRGTYEGGSVYRFLEEQCAIELVGGLADVTAVAADDEISGLLDVPPGTSLLRIDQVERSTVDRPVLHSTEHYVPTVLNLSIRRVRHRGPATELTPELRSPASKEGR